MSEYFLIISAAASILGGVYILLLAFKLYKPRTATEEQTTRMQISLTKFGTFAKVCGIGMIAYGLYFFILRKEEQWTPEFRQSLFQDLRTSKTISRYPQFADEACNCMTDSIISKMTVSQYRRAMAKEPVERFQEIQPFIRNCFDTLNKRIRGLDTTNKTFPR